MKKVLMITHIPTHPQNEGGRLRVYNIIQDMRELDIDLHLLYISNNLDDDIPAMEEFIGKDKFFIYKDSKYKKLKKVRYVIIRMLRLFLKTIGLGKKVIIHNTLDDFYQNDLTTYIKQLNEKYNYDVAWVEYVYFSKALEAFGENVIKVIDTLDVYANRENVYLKNGKIPTGYYITKKEEVKGLSRANYVVAIQEQEKNYFREILDKNIEVLTIGNSIKPVNPEVVNNKNYIFVGSNNELNQYSIDYFIKNVLPIIKQKDSKANLQIVGGVCKSVPDSQEYTKLGIVDDISEVYKNARVVINPIKSGTGLNIKTIEALGYSKPLITTTVGAKGLDCDKDTFIVVDEDNEFAENLVQVLNDDEKAKNLSNKAFEFINNYNKEVKENIKQILY